LGVESGKTLLLLALKFIPRHNHSLIVFGELKIGLIGILIRA